MSKSIFQLSSIDALAAGDLFPIGDISNSDTRKAALSVLTEYLQANLDFSGQSLTRQSAAPSATGFSVTIDIGNTWLILTPVAGYAAGTIVLPTGVDGEEVLVNCTQVVTTLTITSTSTVTGAPTALVANDFFKLKFDEINDTWYRIG